MQRLIWACSSVGRAFGSHPRGQGFESLQVHQIKRLTDSCQPFFLRAIPSRGSRLPLCGRFFCWRPWSGASAPWGNPAAARGSFTGKSTAFSKKSFKTEENLCKNAIRAVKTQFALKVPTNAPRRSIFIVQKRDSLVNVSWKDLLIKVK